MRVQDLAESSKHHVRRIADARKVTVHTSSGTSSYHSSIEEESSSQDGQYQTTGRNTLNSAREQRRGGTKAKELEKLQNLSARRSEKNAVKLASSTNREEILTKCKQAIENLTFEID